MHESRALLAAVAMNLSVEQDVPSTAQSPDLLLVISTQEFTSAVLLVMTLVCVLILLALLLAAAAMCWPTPKQGPVIGGAPLQHEDAKAHGDYENSLLPSPPALDFLEARPRVRPANADTKEGTSFSRPGLSASSAG